MLTQSIYSLIVAVFVAASSATPTSAAELPCPSILDHKIVNLQDQPVSLCQFRGKVLLIVNTASECGYTPQYEGLEKLYRRYRKKEQILEGQIVTFDIAPGAAAKRDLKLSLLGNCVCLRNSPWPSWQTIHSLLSHRRAAS